jgi:hypothetical protein
MMQRMHRRTLLVSLATAVALVACSSGGQSGTTTTVAPTTTPAAPSTSVGCSLEGDTARDAENFPNTLSSLVGKDVRYAVLDACTERVVIELQGTGTFPGWQVMYEDAPTQGESDEPVDLAGDAALVATLGSWMTTMEGVGYEGPTDITATGTRAIKELRMIENFEGMTRWAIGLDTQRPFTVSVLPDPPRLVIDIAVPQ